MLVVDTYIIAGLYLKNPNTADIQALLARDPHWFAPRLWRSEFRNILIQYIRHGTIALVDAWDLMAAGEKLIDTVDIEAMAARVLRLAHSSGCSAYDCEYVALARDMGTTLITFDNKLLTAFPTIAATPSAFLTASG